MTHPVVLRKWTDKKVKRSFLKVKGESNIGICPEAINMPFLENPEVFYFINSQNRNILKFQSRKWKPSP